MLDSIVHLLLVLPPVVPGYLLPIWFGRRGVIGAFLADWFGIVLAFRWTGAALACGVMGFPLLVRAIRLSIEAVDTKLEDASWTLGANRFLVFATVTTAARGAVGIIAGMVLCGAKRPRRVRRDHHLRLQHSGRDADDFGRDLHLYADPERRRGGGAARRRGDRDLAGRADRLRMARTPRRPAPARGRLMLAVDVEKQLGDFTIRAKFETLGGVTALFGPSGSGKTSIINMVAGLLTPDRGRIMFGSTLLFDGAGGFSAPPNRRGIGYVFQDGRLFPHMTVAQNLDYRAGRRIRPFAARRGRAGAHRHDARHRSPARPSSGTSLGRRTPAHRDRTRAADAAAACCSTEHARKLVFDAARKREIFLHCCACATRPSR